MLYRRYGSDEGYIHVCDDSHRYNKQALKDRIEITVHDISTSMLLEGKDGYRFEHIKYCPYCGAKLEDEIETASNEFYKV